MQTKVKPDHDRVAVFHSVEVQREAAPGEWLRVSKDSTKPISELVNGFLEQTGSAVRYISSPTITLVDTSKEQKTRTYRCSVSIIYRPAEVIHDQTKPPSNIGDLIPEQKGQQSLTLESFEASPEAKEHLLRILGTTGLGGPGFGVPAQKSKPTPKKAPPAAASTTSIPITDNRLSDLANKRRRIPRLPRSS